VFSTFPPVKPQKDSPPGAHLYQFFRPEFLARHSTQLHPFEKEDEDGALAKATNHLLKTTIPHFSQELEGICTVMNWKDLCVTRLLHSRGINLRYMGAVASLLNDGDAKLLLIIEMVARTIKRNLRMRVRAKMKQLKFPLETPYISETVGYLNDCIFNSTDAIWSQHIAVGLEKYYKFTSSTPLHTFFWAGPKQNYSNLLLERTCDMLGLVLRESALRQAIPAPRVVKEDNNNKDRLQRHLLFIDVFDVGTRVQQLPMIEHLKGYLWKELAVIGTDPRSFYSSLATQNWKNARDCFREGLRTDPLNGVLLRNYAHTSWQSVKEHPHSKITSKIQLIKYTFENAIQNGAKDTITHYQYAKFLYEIGELSKAEDQLLCSLESNRTNADSIQLLETVWKNIPTCLHELKQLVGEKAFHGPISEFPTFFIL